ncbi:hypothetical protein ACFQVC_40960 [Streptomyces monticola]|uniref:Uncharacterized protein n=1 Tax=Streptomyces monticola TaxID=2666263 RepID=A0ABW2JWV4_9ACTN
MIHMRKAVAVAAGTVMVLGLGALPAHAENYHDTYLSNWGPGKESSRWADNNRDSVKTSIRFSSCYTDGASGFNSATLKLSKDVFGPDDHYGSRTNKCNTSTWGDQSKGDYYFTLTGVNSGGVLTVKSVRITW